MPGLFVKHAHPSPRPSQSAPVSPPLRAEPSASNTASVAGLLTEQPPDGQQSPKFMGYKAKTEGGKVYPPRPPPSSLLCPKKSGEVIKTFSAPYSTNTTGAIGLREHQMLVSFCGIFGSVSTEISQSVVVLNKLKHLDEIASEALKV